MLKVVNYEVKYLVTCLKWRDKLQDIQRLNKYDMIKQFHIHSSEWENTSKEKDEWF